MNIPTLSFRGTTTPVTEFTAGELRKFFAQTPSRHGLRAIQFEIRGGDHDAFEFRTVGDNGLQATAANDRSLLYAAYALLEVMGWQFPVPGEDHFDPHAGNPSGWKQLTGRTEAAFQWRSLSVGCPSDGEIATVIDWMAKRRLNSIFIGHNGNSDQSRALLPELKQRGVRLESGGHILRDFLPAELFNRHPEYFRMENGARRSNGNFCASGPGTLPIIAAHAVEYARQLPDATVFHFWGDDVEGGSWCACPLCAHLSPVEQLMTATNAVAVALARERPGATVDFLLYHDTLEVPDSLRPAPNTFALYAPRERCYAHGLGDPTCPRNVWYDACLERARKLFGRRISVFEYYTSFMLWRCLGISIPASILADLHWYKSKGIADVQTLHFGQVTNWSCPLNPYVFARAAWDANLKRDAIIAEFSRSRYGEYALAMQSSLTAMEQASLNTLTYCGYDRSAYDLRDVPLHPDGFAAQHRARVEQAVALTEAALRAMPTTDHHSVAADRQMLELNRDNLRALRHQMSYEYDPAIALLHDLRQRWTGLSPKLTGAWREDAGDQFKLIADLLESAKAGRRHRTW